MAVSADNPFEDTIEREAKNSTLTHDGCFFFRSRWISAIRTQANPE